MAVCDRLGQLRDAISRYAAGFDPSALSGEQAALAVGEAAAIEKMAATLKGLAAARSADSMPFETLRLDGSPPP